MKRIFFIQMYLGSWPRWPPCPYKVKTLKTSSLGPKGQWTWDLVCSIGDVVPTKFAGRMILGWPWPTLQQGQRTSDSLNEGMPIKSFKENNIFSMKKIVILTHELYEQVFFALDQYLLKNMGRKHCFCYSTYRK